MRHSRWHLHPPQPPAQLRRWPGLAPLMAQLLHNRGLSPDGPWEPFLRADRSLLHDPFLLPDMEAAVARLERALATGEVIAVYGDFDADGITATVLLVQGLGRLGGQALPYIPHRIEEGYGLNSASLEALAGQGVKVVVTVDCGISSPREVEAARGLGLDVIITDHHTVPGALPPALAAIDPHRPDSAYPFPDLAGVGLAFKLYQALLQARGQPIPEEALDLVALGTVADMVPLLGENRYLVKRGLEAINTPSRPGLKALVAASGLQPGGLDAESISYTLAPRLNAAGRLDHALRGYRLLASDSIEQAQPLAGELEALNRERQRLTAQVLARAREMVAPGDAPLLLAGAPDFPAGVVGIVAGKLAEEFYRPAVVLEVGEAVSRGSARSIPEFDIVRALGQCGDLLFRYGGHPQAAGFTLPTPHIPLLQERLLGLAQAQLSGLDLRPHLPIDAELRLFSLGPQLLNLLGQLAPFGQGNPAPAFLTRRARLVECQPLGQEGRHLRLKFQEGNVTWLAVGFDLGPLASGLALPGEGLAPYLDIVYNLEVDRWGSTPLLRLNLLDLALPGEGLAPSEAGWPASS